MRTQKNAAQEKRSTSDQRPEEKESCGSGEVEKTKVGVGTEKQAAEALVATEESEEGVVQLKTWASYVRAGGGACRFASVILLFIFTQFVRVGCDWWVSRWTEGAFTYQSTSANETSNHTTFAATGSKGSSRDGGNNVDWINGSAVVAVENMSGLGARDYALGYGLVVVSFTAIMFLRSVAFTMTMLQASQTLHDGMFSRVLRAPMNWFWHQVTGRILNRFSKDMDCIDRLMVLAGMRPPPNPKRARARVHVHACTYTRTHTCTVIRVRIMKFIQAKALNADAASRSSPCTRVRRTKRTHAASSGAA